jgi:hypothetical protein
VIVKPTAREADVLHDVVNRHLLEAMPVEHDTRSFDDLRARSRLVLCGIRAWIGLRAAPNGGPSIYVLEHKLPGGKVAVSPGRGVA